LRSDIQLLVGTDVTELLGVLKYEPPIPAQLVGKIKGFFPGFIPKTDEERIQNMGDVLTGFYVTEKLDGSSVTYYKKDGVFGVCSRNLELLETDGNTHWRLAREMDLENKLPDNMALQGELVGEGLQGNPYRLTGQAVYFYNAYAIYATEGGRYLDFVNFKAICDAHGLKTVPILDENFALPHTVEAMLSYADGKSLLNPDVAREGVVVRPKTEMQFNGQRFSFKVVSNQYLLNENEN
jgi:RNA ligase (TIGR02306 family)